MKQPPRQVTLFTKPGCHLCEDALAGLRHLRGRYPHELTIVDITTDAELWDRYRTAIPVLVVDGIEHPAPLFAATLERALRGRP